MKIVSSLDIGSELWAIIQNRLTRITVKRVELAFCKSHLEGEVGAEACNYEQVAYVGTYFNPEHPDEENRHYFYEEDLGVKLFGTKSELIQDLANKSV